jgi:pimeloyl-ACP methyl ester carboxylesterase
MYVYLVILLAVGATLAMIVGAGLVFPAKRPVSPSADDRHASVLEARVRYRIHENGDDAGQPVILLLHGFGGSLDYWREIQPLLTQNRSIAVDLVGFGGSDSPPISYDLDTQWRYLEAFMAALDLRKVVVAGISMGGSLSAWTAAKSQDRIVGLVMIAPSGVPGSLRKSWPHGGSTTGGKLSWLAVTAAHRWLPKSIAAQALSVTNSYDAQFEAALRNIRQPALLAWSRGDDTTLYEYNSVYRQRIRNLEFRELPVDLDHQVLERDPQGTASLINAFVAGLSQHR